MELIKLIQRESKDKLRMILIMAVVSGISNAFLLAILNQATNMDLSSMDNIRIFTLFMGSISLFILTKRFVLKKSAFLVHEVIRKMRNRITNKIRHSNLLNIEETGTSEIYARITQDSNQISHTFSFVGNAFQSTIMVVFSVIYISFISIHAFLIVAIALSVGVFLYVSYRKEITQVLIKASYKENEFFGTLNAILYGFKEIKVNQKKNTEVYDRFNTISVEARELKLVGVYKFIRNYLSTQTFFFLLLAVIIFLLPQYIDLTNRSLVKISAAILFIIGPLDSIMSTIPMLIQANVATGNVIRLEKKLEEGLDSEFLRRMDDEENNVAYDPITFNDEIKITNLKFKYPDKNGSDPFSIGPINLSLKKGNIYYFTGGNGAGKSTFLKLFAGLYYPNEGVISVDEVPVSEYNYQNYRELFSLIFTDFHLFDRLYALMDYDQQKVDDLLREMKIISKTQIINGKITNRELSTGQRKRLALVVAILEDRPVLIFDEVAADQDPEFKKYFYTHLMKDLKKKGKTIIVVSHDDKYFDTADLQYKIENGIIVNSSSST